VEVAPPLRLDATEKLLGRGEQCDAWVATHREGLDFDTFTSGVFPRFAERASGCRVWDVDGNEYIDFILGHADQRVIAAVTRELATGTCISPLWRATQVELNGLLTSVIPNADLVERSSTSGSTPTS
jgi:glutamate-1-semialdehyde aminotransferase